jgi:KDO2-lipid IV(A) lauroyltransferase
MHPTAGDISRDHPRVSLEKPLHYLAYIAVRLFICLVQAVRIETCERIADILATIATDVIPLRRKLVDENLRHAFPELDERRRRRLAKRMWKHLFLFVAEVAHAPRKIHETNWRQYVRLQDADLLVRVLLDNRPAILVSGHFGNFELCGFMMGVLGFPTYTVARPLDNPYLHEFVGRFRGATGQHIIPTKGGYDQIQAVLRGGGAMAFLADQYAGTKGCWVQFFGRPASAHKAIGLLALDNDAPMAVGYAMRLGKPLQYQLTICDVADPRDTADRTVTGVRPLTQWYSRTIEEFVRLAPDQYWWLHDRWKDRRSTKQRSRQAA